MLIRYGYQPGELSLGIFHPWRTNHTDTSQFRLFAFRAGHMVQCRISNIEIEIEVSEGRKNLLCMSRDYHGRGKTERERES